MVLRVKRDLCLNNVIMAHIGGTAGTANVIRFAAYGQLVRNSIRNVTYNSVVRLSVTKGVIYQTMFENRHQS